MRLTLTFALLTVATCARAEDAPKPADAEKVAAAGLEAMSKADWKVYAELLHPDSLKAFRDVIVPALKAAARANKADRELLGIFGGAKDVETVLAWKPKDFFVKTMSALTRVPATKAMFTSRKAKVVGTVLEGKELAHVVVRVAVTVDTVEMKYVGVVQLKQHGSKWKLLADDLVTRLATGVKRTCELHVSRP
jgi:hypothetical protein